MISVYLEIVGLTDIGMSINELTNKYMITMWALVAVGVAKRVVGHFSARLVQPRTHNHSTLYYLHCIIVHRSFTRDYNLDYGMSYRHETLQIHISLLELNKQNEHNHHI